MKNIEKQLKLIDEFFNETPKEVIDKMMEEVLRECPDEEGITFDDYCALLSETLGGHKDNGKKTSNPVEVALEKEATVIYSAKIPETAVDKDFTDFTTKDKQLLAA